MKKSITLDKQVISSPRLSNNDIYTTQDSIKSDTKRYSEQNGISQKLEINKEVINVSSLVSDRQSISSLENVTTKSVNNSSQILEILKDLIGNRKNRENNNNKVLKILTKNIKDIYNIRERKFIESVVWKRLSEFCFKNFTDLNVKYLISAKWTGQFVKYIGSDIQNDFV